MRVYSVCCYVDKMSEHFGPPDKYWTVKPIAYWGVLSLKSKFSVLHDFFILLIYRKPTTAPDEVFVQVLDDKEI